MKQIHRLIDLEFNQLVESVLLVVEHEKTLGIGTEFLSIDGSKMLHEAVDVAKDNMKEFF
tara:strand:- start:31 stop:210 length:180 start_codon:yes stop_codon:yes gene_type:complete